MYRKYYSYSDMPQLIKHEPQNEQKPDNAKKTECEAKPKCEEKSENQDSGGLLGGNMFEDGKLFGKFELDDIILAIIVLALLMDDCEDNMLLIVLGFIFLSGIIQF